MRTSANFFLVALAFICLFLMVGAPAAETNKKELKKALRAYRENQTDANKATVDEVRARYWQKILRFESTMALILLGVSLGLVKFNFDPKRLER